MSGYNKEKIGFDLSTISSQMWYRIASELGINPNPDRDISDIVFKLRSIKMTTK